MKTSLFSASPQFRTLYGGRAMLLVSSGKITSFMCILVAMLVLAAAQNSTAEEVRTNFTILDSLTKAAIQQLCAASGVESDSIVCSVKEHAAEWLVTARLAEYCPKIHLRAPTPSTGTLGITSFGVRYERLTAYDDSLRRICTVAFAGTFIRKSGELAAFPATTVSHADIIAISDITSAESGGYDFSRGAIPQRDSGFMKDIIEPLVIVSTAALTVLLLFTVRSQ